MPRSDPWVHIENVATLTAACFLCWLFDSPWGSLVLLNLAVTQRRGDDVTEPRPGQL